MIKNDLTGRFCFADSNYEHISYDKKIYMITKDDGDFFQIFPGQSKFVSKNRLYDSEKYWIKFTLI